MSFHKQNLEHSLRCLQHPTTLISIALLILNDHVLKTSIPSWFTGKLSDFAGLFFFPFIIATGLSILFAKYDLKRHTIGHLSFGVVAIGFFLIKTIPSVNNVTAKIASFVIGGTPQIIIDPTDLIALLVMGPGWVLWCRYNETKSTKFAYIVLCLGSFAALATSPIERTVTSVTDLVSTDGIVYVADRETFGKENYPVGKSIDGGSTWELDYEKESLPELGEKIYPIIQCINKKSSIGSRICYRVTNSHQLEISNDNQENWYKVFYSDDLTVRARDILIIIWDEKEYLLVAVGENGILRRELPDGNWEIINVINARNR